MNLSVIVFRNNLILSKIKYIKCHQLMCTSIPCTHKRPYCNDMIVKITCFGNDEISILGYTNYLIELNYVIGFTHKKNLLNPIIYLVCWKKNVLEIIFIYKNQILPKKWGWCQ